MKEKISNKKKKIVNAILMTVIMLAVVGMCGWGIPVLIENDEEIQNETTTNIKIDTVEQETVENEIKQQQNGLMDFIKVTYNDTNGKNYSFTLDNEDIDSIKIGTQISTNDYVYTYGYYWTENDAHVVPKDNSLEGWTEQGSDIGWGVAVKNRSKKTYEDIYSTIAGEPITWLNGTFYNCVYLAQAPSIPFSAKHTDFMFYNCQKLQSVIFPDGITFLGTQMFYKCTSLKYIYLPASVEDMAKNEANAFKDCLANLKIYCEHEIDYFSNQSALNHFEIIYKIPYDEIIRIKHDEFNGV